jgi:hypothetical protein
MFTNTPGSILPIVEGDHSYEEHSLKPQSLDPLANLVLGFGEEQPLFCWPNFTKKQK